MRFCLEVAICLAFFINASSTVGQKKGIRPATKTNDVFDVENNEDILKHKRYARHVQAITESVVDHIMKKIRTRYPNIKNRMPKDKFKRIAQDMKKMLNILKPKKRQNNQRKKTTKKSKKKTTGKQNSTRKTTNYWRNKLMYMN